MTTLLLSSIPSTPLDYDYLVIGGGAAGLTAAGLGASLGAKTLLVERHRLGGDCTWTGCIPSKTLLHAARVAHTVRTADAVGIGADAPRVDFAAVLDRVHRVRQHVYDEADAPERLAAFGVETAHAEAVFLDPHTVRLTDADGSARRVTFEKGLIATGSRPVVPTIDGLDGVPFLTNETLFELTEQPASLLVLGAGPIGIEMAQAFARLGTRVTVIDKGGRPLSHDDPELVALLLPRLDADGIAFRFHADVTAVEKAGQGVSVHLKGGETLHADRLLVATGREARTDGLGLDAAGVETNTRCIVVDETGRTSRHHLYAAGDVSGGPQFTHWCEHSARVATLHALVHLPGRLHPERLPWVTYTDPELAHVGATARELKEAGTAFETYRFPFDRLDRALTEDAPVGLVKVYARGWDGKVYGASILGERAGDLIATFAVALTHGLTLRHLADTLLPYPTFGQAPRRAADQWYAAKQTPGLVRIVQKVFGLRGPVIAPEPGRIV